MSAQPVSLVSAPAEWRTESPLIWRHAATLHPAGVRPPLPVPVPVPLPVTPLPSLTPLSSPALPFVRQGLGLDDALGWAGLEARLSPVIGQHGLVALYHRSVALARRAPAPHGLLSPAQAFYRLLAELLGAELAERLLPDAAERR